MLCYATQAVEIIHMLLDHGADITALSGGPSKKAGQSALYRATVFGHCGQDDKVLMALLGRGAHWSTAAVPREISEGLLLYACDMERERTQQSSNNNNTQKLNSKPVLLRRKSSL